MMSLCSAVHALAAAVVALAATEPPPPAHRLAPAASTLVRFDLLARGYKAVPMHNSRLAEHRFVTLKVNGQPLSMVIDTGSTVCVVMPDIAARLKLPRGNEGRVNFLRATVPGVASLIARYELGGVTGGNLTAIAADIRAGLGAGPWWPLLKCDGIIGYDFLNAHAAHLDLASDTLYLLPAHHAEAEALAGEWGCVGRETENGPAEYSTWGGASLTFTGENVSLKVVGDGAMHFVADASYAPARLSMYNPRTDEDGTASIGEARGVYKIDGELLTVCFRKTTKDNEDPVAPVDLRAGPNWVRQQFRRTPGSAPPKSAPPRIAPALAQAGYTIVPTTTFDNANARLVPVRVGGEELSLRLDTGADRATIGLSAADRCGLIIKDRPEVIADKHGVGSVYRAAVGDFPCGQTKFAVARFRDGHTGDGLLGLDFLTAHAAHIDCKTHALYLRHPNADAGLSGKWVCESGETVEGPIEPGRCAAISYEFEQNRVRCRTSQMDEQFHYLSTRRTEPAELILYRPSKPGHPESICYVNYDVYRLNGDRLTISVNHTGKKYNSPPKDFKPNPDWVVFHLKRVKPESPDHTAPVP